MNIIGKALLSILVGAAILAVLFGIGWCIYYVSTFYPLIYTGMLSVVLCGLLGYTALSFKK